MNKTSLKLLREALLNWYAIHKRELPWRGDKSAYRIWISEIILQQTRVEQGLPYYIRFIERFPDVKSLAKADEQEVLKLWQGLGYYSRGRNLHAAAKTIVKDYGGEFPDTSFELQKLKGIGKYTSAAISSIVFGEKAAVLDGNVYRVLARIFAEQKPINDNGAEKIFSAYAAQLLYEENPGEWNQSMMELGAMVCTPNKPDCPLCPLKSYCKSYKENLAEVLPVKLSKIKISNRYLHYFFIKDNGKILLKKRTAKDIWRGLYDFPMAESGSKKLDVAIAAKKNYKVIKGSDVVHNLTHRQLHIYFYEADKVAAPYIDINGASFWVHLKDLKKYPLPKPIENFLKNFGSL